MKTRKHIMEMMIVVAAMLTMFTACKSSKEKTTESTNCTENATVLSSIVENEEKEIVYETLLIDGAELTFPCSKDEMVNWFKNNGYKIVGAFL